MCDNVEQHLIFTRNYILVVYFITRLEIDNHTYCLVYTSLLSSWGDMFMFFCVTTCCHFGKYAIYNVCI